MCASGALAGGLGRGAGLGRQERHGGDRERDRGRPSRGGGGRFGESFGRRRYQGRAGDAGHRRHVLRQRHGGEGRRASFTQEGERRLRRAPRREALDRRSCPREGRRGRLRGRDAVAGRVGRHGQVDRGRRPFTRASLRPARPAGPRRARPRRLAGRRREEEERGRRRGGGRGAARAPARPHGGPRLGAPRRSRDEEDPRRLPEPRGRYLTEVLTIDNN
mmetsp:Transcript_6331/g.18785  ORF Transcript_6331/g.18785 Transcript_6331/m.18785 type:complete len:219 (+) Transcript_6331:2422-3078(+)